MTAEMIQKAFTKRPLTLNLLSGRYQEAAVLAGLRRDFARDDYVKLPALLNGEAMAQLKVEAALLERFARNKDFVMDVPGYETPRIMTTLGGQTMMRELPKLGLENVPLLGRLYTHYEVWNLLQEIIGASIYPCLHPNEFIVINYLLARGNTHGWHLDDPAYALVIFLNAPLAREDGGLIEYIRNWRAMRDDSGISPKEKIENIVEHCRAVGLVKSNHHAPGDAYLLRADQCLHQVSPLLAEGARRVVLNLGFEATPNPTYGPSATLLYSEA